MNRIRGSLIVTLLPSLIFAAAAAAGWYLFYGESSALESAVSRHQSEQKTMTFKAEQFQWEIERLNKSNKTLVDEKERIAESQVSFVAEKAKLQAEVEKMSESQQQAKASLERERTKLQALQVNLDQERKKQQELQTSLNEEKKLQQKLQSTLTALKSEKGAIESNLQKETKKIASTTAELQEKLVEKQKQQQSLSDQMGSVSSEKKQLSTLLKQEQLKRQQLEQQITEVNKGIDKKENALSQAKGEVSQLNLKLAETLESQSTLKDQIEVLSEQRRKDSEQFSQLKQLLEKELNKSQVEISQLKNKMTVINLTSGILFSTGSAELKPEGRKVLALVAKSLNSYPDRSISVEGHTDIVPVGNDSPFGSNWELSAERAVAAVRYFQYTKAVDPKRLRVVGYGEHQPVSENETAKGRELNRRIEIRILPAISDVPMESSSEAKKVDS